jgi:CheY-like chemotaxis protein
MQYTSMGNTTTILESQLMTPGFVPDSPYALIVDDDDAILSVVMLLLETEGHAAVGFSDSTKVIPFLEQTDKEHLPSVVLLDLMMPVVSGYEIAAKLSQNARYSSIPIIIMTADNRVKNASAVPGASDWVGKPFQMSTLLAKLEQFLPPAAP